MSEEWKQHADAAVDDLRIELAALVFSASSDDPDDWQGRSADPLCVTRSGQQELTFSWSYNQSVSLGPVTRSNVISNTTSVQFSVSYSYYSLSC